MVVSSSLRRDRSRNSKGSSRNASRNTSGRSAAAVDPSKVRSMQQPLKARNRQGTLRAMPSRMPIPNWLQLLKKTEQISLICAFGLVGGAVVTYGWAFYSQQQWGQNYRHLDTLRRNERQLLKSSELMKNDIARHNDPKQYGLVPRHTDHIVVIPPAPLRPALPTRNSGPDPKAKPMNPIGY